MNQKRYGVGSLQQDSIERLHHGSASARGANKYARKATCETARCVEAICIRMYSGNDDSVVQLTKSVAVSLQFGTIPVE